MSQKRLCTVGIVLTLLLWAAVGVAAALLPGDGTDVLSVLAATVTICVTLFSMRRRTERVFMHGYHAGFHDASKAACQYAEHVCDVLVLSEERARRAT